MNKLTLKIVTLTLMFFAVNCSNFDGKSSYMFSFVRVVESVDNKQIFCSDEDWERADARFKQFVKTDYQKYGYRKN
jgi:hypothetical protein